MGKWSRRAFVTSGVAAGGVVVFGLAIRRGDRAERVRGLIADSSDTIFDTWLKFSPDGTITVVVPHAEMGQGAHTALAMMLADELDADEDELLLLADKVPDEMRKRIRERSELFRFLASVSDSDLDAIVKRLDKHVQG